MRLLLAVGVAMVLAGVSILGYSGIAATAMSPNAGVWWVQGLPRTVPDPTRPRTVGDLLDGKPRPVAIVHGTPGRVVAAWGVGLIAVGGGVTAFGWSARPRVRAGR